MDLDNYDHFKRFDSKGLMQNIVEIPSQLETAQAEVDSVVLPVHFLQANKILLLSNSFSYPFCVFIKEYFSRAHLPIVISYAADLPGFVDSKTLVVIASFDSEDERLATSFSCAAKAGAKIYTVCTGGTLASLSRKFQTPYFEIRYGSSPKAAWGYLIVVLYSLFSKLRIIDELDDMKEAVILIKALNSKIKADAVTSKNIAKQTALSLKDRLIYITAGSAFKSVGIKFFLQIVSCAKNIAHFYEVGSFVSNVLSSFDYPVKLKEKICVVIFQSKFDSPLDKVLQASLIQYLDLKRIKYESIFIQPGGSRLSEALQAVLLGDYIGYYLAMLNGTDPDVSESFEQFKELQNFAKGGL